MKISDLYLRGDDGNRAPIACYILDEDGQPVAVEHFETWARWFTERDRRIAVNIIGSVQVSTAFLGIAIDTQEPPLLWETLISGDAPGARTEARYASAADAIAGHARIVEELRRAG